MLTITQEILNQIVTHAKNELPNEACGYLAGLDDKITHHYPLTNIDHSPEHFSFDPAEQFRTLKDARRLGLQIIAVYHSHPQSPARPSLEDIKLAYDPNIRYVIISLAKEYPEIKSYFIKNGVIETEEIRITEN